MITLTEEEKKFIKVAIVNLKRDSEKFDLDPKKQEDLLIIINNYRARGYLTSRRIDGGKDSNIWHQLRAKLGSPVKDQKTILEDQLQENAEGLVSRLNKAHNNKIEDLQKRLEEAKLEKVEAIGEVEQKIIDEIKLFDDKKLDALKRLGVAKNAREKLIRIKKHEKHKIDKEVDGMAKCWECGEWFKAGAGIANHKRAKHGE